MSIEDLLSIVRDAGFVGLAITILFGGAKEVWVWGWQYRAVVKERDELRAIVYRAVDLTDQSLDLAEGKTKSRRRA
jgi:hypothetical protein